MQTANGHPPITLTDHKHIPPVVDLIYLLMLLGVHNRGYSASKLVDYVAWFQQTPQSQKLVL